MALFYAIPRRDTKKIAKDLLAKFHTIQNIFDVDPKELREIKGLSDHSVYFLKFFL